MSKYLCWNCGLWQGDEQDDLESSKLCPTCRAAIEAARAPHGAPRAAYDAAADPEQLELLNGTATPVYRPEEGTE